MMILDVHQKTSELLDLLKYIAFMPFSDITRLSALIEDKFNIMLKTKLDAWTLQTLKKLIKELSNKDKINARKPKLQLHNGMPINESFGMKLELPSIFDLKIRHTKPVLYIEDISAIYTVRGKQFFGSQFMDKSITMTAEWEKKKYGNWVIDGTGDGSFPFKSNFAFSKDGIYYAQELY
ncbi:unnamed protein product [Euphydryas editha]|uniref:Uncharacterized protein n=1 Tax=Euphydryas editha TaxID=104508 RepID=A0AAU9UNZ5_EUPED|nr:unnamed protein product [Euphydryas editha]